MTLELIINILMTYCEFSCSDPLPRLFKNVDLRFFLFIFEENTRDYYTPPPRNVGLYALGNVDNDGCARSNAICHLMTWSQRGNEGIAFALLGLTGHTGTHWPIEGSLIRGPWHGQDRSMWYSVAV